MENNTKVTVPATLTSTLASTTASGLPGIYGSPWRRDAELSLAPIPAVLLPAKPIQDRPCSSLADGAATKKYNIQNSTVMEVKVCRSVNAGAIFHFATFSPSIIRSPHAHLEDSIPLEGATLNWNANANCDKSSSKLRTGKLSGSFSGKDKDSETSFSSLGPDSSSSTGCSKLPY